MRQILTKRVYEPPSPDDGLRVLVDRIWPRGLSKATAALDLWLKDIAPSTELRKWYGHRPERWLEFKKRYDHELDRNQPAVAQLMTLPGDGPVTLLFAAHDLERSNAEALRQYLVRTRRRAAKK